MKRERFFLYLTSLVIVLVFGATGYIHVLRGNTEALLAKRDPLPAVQRFAHIQDALRGTIAAPAEDTKPAGQQTVPVVPTQGQSVVTQLTVSELDAIRRSQVFIDRFENKVVGGEPWDAIRKDLFARPVSSWTPSDWARLNTFLAENEALLAEIRALAAEGGPLYPLDLSQGYATLLPHLAPTRAFAQLLQASAIARAHAGDPDGAAADILAGLRLGARVGEEPILISQLVNAAIDSIMHEAVVGAFPEGRIPIALVDELARQFFAANLPDSFLQSARGEHGFGMDFMAQLMDSGWSQGEDIAGLIDVRNGVAGSWGGYLYGTPLARPWQYLDAQSYTRIMNDFEATLNMPYYEAREAIDAISGEVDALPFTRVFTRAMVPSMLGMHQAIARIQARQQILLLGAAVESYANEHGAWPPRIEDIQGQAHGASIIDPFTGAPFHYNTSGNGFELYSVGQNLNDDGGRHDFIDGDIVWRGNPPPAPATANLVAQKK